MAAATADRPANQQAPQSANPVDVAKALDGKDDMPAAELLKKVGEKAMNIAWTGGYIEFGQRDYTIVGNPYDQQYRLASQFHLGSGTNWTNEKKPKDCTLREIFARCAELPDCGTYKRNRAGESGYVPSAPDESPLVNISREEAVKTCYLKVRLTDKGHQLLISE